MRVTTHRRRPWPNWAISTLENNITRTRTALHALNELIDHAETRRDTVAGVALAKAYRDIAQVHHSLVLARQCEGPDNTN